MEMSTKIKLLALTVLCLFISSLKAQEGTVSLSTTEYTKLVTDKKDLELEIKSKSDSISKLLNHNKLNQQKLNKLDSITKERNILLQQNNQLQLDAINLGNALRQVKDSIESNKKIITDKNSLIVTHNISIKKLDSLNKSLTEELKASSNRKSNLENELTLAKEKLTSANEKIKEKERTIEKIENLKKNCEVFLATKKEEINKDYNSLINGNDFKLDKAYGERLKNLKSDISLVLGKDDNKYKKIEELESHWNILKKYENSNLVELTPKYLSDAIEELSSIKSKNKNLINERKKIYNNLDNYCSKWVLLRIKFNNLKKDLNDTQTDRHFTNTKNNFIKDNLKEDENYPIIRKKLNAYKKGSANPLVTNPLIKCPKF